MDPAVLGLILTSAFVGLAVSWLLARFVRIWAAWVLVGLLALAVAGFILAGRVTQGWDGLAYVILALIFAGPAMLGAALGAALGGWMRERARRGRGIASRQSH